MRESATLRKTAPCNTEENQQPHPARMGKTYLKIALFDAIASEQRIA